MKGIIVSEQWIRLLKKIRRCKTPSIIFVMGAVDTGKTTLAKFLCKQLGKAESVALVDADLGQSTIGPPTTIGLAMNKNYKSALNTLSLRFVGATSPVGHLLQTLVAVKKLVDKAISLRADRVIVDTSGFISGAVGREFKFQKIDLINPNCIITLQKKNELKLLLKNLSQRKGVTIQQLRVKEQEVKLKSPGQRRLNRQKKFKVYFNNAKVKSLSLKKLGLHGMVPDLSRREKWHNLLIGLCDEENNTLALGIIQDIDLSRGRISCITPIKKRIDKVKTVQFGSIYLNRNGQEL